MEKKCKKILSVKIMSVPLHPQIAKVVLLRRKSEAGPFVYRLGREIFIL